MSDQEANEQINKSKFIYEDDGEGLTFTVYTGEDEEPEGE